MTLHRSLWTTVMVASCAALIGAALLPGCSSSGDAGTAGPAGPAGPGAAGTAADGAVLACAPGSRSCKSDTVAQVCATDGSAQTDQPCGVGERCTGGSCVSSTNPNVCQDATTALRRLPTGAFEVVKCPAGTACTGPGLCKGTFVVGSTQCSTLQSLATSADGLTQVQTACAAGQLCVSTGDTNGVPTAACKASECIPAALNLATCSNPKAPTVAVGKAVTKCLATPEGYKFVTTLCTGTATCIPGSSANNNTNTAATDARCASACIPGTSRCTGNAVATCLADGTWNLAPVACLPGTACTTNPTDPSKALCGDPACVASHGACEGTSFRACTATATLAAAVPCAGGICADDGFGGGLCVAECTAGEERCVANNSTAFQTCVGGRWSATATSCPSSGTCQTYRAATGLSAKICGADCAPGSMRCAIADGGAVGTEATQTCNAAGKWGTATACTIGTCKTNNNAAACTADCVPNSLVCTGGGANVPGTPYNGTNGFQSCTATGKLDPTVTNCAGGTFCRSKAGRAIIPAGATNACLTCVGSGIAGGDEDGLVDSRCADATGAATGNATSQICAADNTWTANTTTCANGCIGPATRSGPTAPICAKTNNQNNEFRTESYYAAHRRGSCVNNRRGGGAPIVCGAIPDCCGASCTFPVPARPASCNAGP